MKQLYFLNNVSIKLTLGMLKIVLNLINQRLVHQYFYSLLLDGECFNNGN